LTILIIIGAIGSFINVPVVYPLSPILAKLGFVFGLLHVTLYFLYKKNVLKYSVASSFALAIVFINILLLPVFMFTGTPQIAWILVYPIISFSLKSIKSAFISSLLLLLALWLCFLLSFLDPSYDLIYILSFSFIYLTVTVITYFINKNVNITTQELERYNQKLASDKNESIVNFQNLMNISMEMIVMFDFSGKIIDVNVAMIQVLGYENKDEIIGRYLNDLIPTMLIPHVAKALNEENTKPYELTILKADGSTLETLASGQYIYQDGKKVRIFTLMDLTQVKYNEKALLQHNRKAQMGDMLAMIAHQWRQPLSSVTAILAGLQIQDKLGLMDYSTKEGIVDAQKYSSSQ
jgi:PAS domain S-box-containing protein